MAARLGLSLGELTEGLDELGVLWRMRRPAEQITFVTCTDGNHGQAVAWAAKRLGQRAVVYMPKGSADARVERVRAQGGEVTFRHRAFRRALLDALPNEEQQRLHAGAAEVLEARGAPALVVGMHRSQALDHEGCLEPLLRALDARVRAGSRRTSNSSGGANV